MPRHSGRPQFTVADSTRQESPIPDVPTFQERTESSITQPPTQTEPAQQAQQEAQPTTTGKRKPASASQWYAHKRSVVGSHPELNSVEQLILAKKTYTPTGRIRSPQSIHREAYLLRNQTHGLEGDALEKAIRADLIARI